MNPWKGILEAASFFCHLNLLTDSLNNEPRRCQCHPNHLLQLKACQDLVRPHRQIPQSQRAQPRHQEIPFEFYSNK